ncbi:MAG: hypothetical protein CV088_16105 [Nitrospira sp. LK70]|nr:hypothetical protein [Nitrospira sp. LK70]
MPVRSQQRLLEHFVACTTARVSAHLVGVQGRTAVVFFQRLRQLVASKQESFLLSGEIEADEGYFGGVKTEVTCPQIADVRCPLFADEIVWSLGSGRG